MKRFEALTEPTGETPDPYEKRRLPMANRKRNIQMKFYVTEEEKWLIDGKMAQLPTRRYGAYLRKMAIDGYIIQLDTTDIKQMNAAKLGTRQGCVERFSPRQSAQRPQGCISAPLLPRDYSACRFLGSFSQKPPRWFTRQGKSEKGLRVLVRHGCSLLS